jgi:hypothetical protein
MSGVFSDHSVGKMVKVSEKQENIFVDEYVILPDSLGGIGKIIFMDLFPSLHTVEKRESKVDLLGVLRYRISYVAEDPFSSIKVMEGEIDIKGQVDFQDSRMSDAVVHTDCRIESVDYSVINSKKVSINAVIKANCALFQQSIEPYLSMDGEDDTAALLKREERLYSLRELKQQDFEVKGKLHIEFEKNEISQVATARIAEIRTETKAMEDGMSLDFYIRAQVGYVDSVGTFCFEYIDFEGQKMMDIEPNYDNVQYILKHTVRDLKVEVMEDNDGEQRVLDLTVDVDVMAEIYEETTIEYLQDIYFMDSKEELVVKEIEILKNLDRLEKSFEERAYYEGVGNFKEVYITSSHLDFTDLKKDHLVDLNGKILMRGILIPEEENAIPKGIEIEMPFTHTIALGMDTRAVEPRVYLRVEDILVSYIDEQKAEFQVYLKAEVELMEKKTIRVVEDVIKGESIEEVDDSSAVVKLYYTCPQDTLWTVCKKYRVKQDALVSINEDLDLEHLETGTMMLIP